MTLDTIGSEIRLSHVNVVRGGDAQGDLVFMPCDERGTPGPLNREILGKLGLSVDALPNKEELSKGYHFHSEKGARACFIVTIGLGATTAQNLKANLTRAFGDPAIGSVKSIWLPLMGTGAGGMAVNRSLELTLNVLRNFGWLSSAGPDITVSLPPNLTAKQLASVRSILSDIDRSLASVVPPTSGSAESDVEHLGTAAEDVPDNLSPALNGVLALAAGMRPTATTLLSTTLALFALAEGRALAAFGPFNTAPFDGAESILGDRSVAQLAAAIGEQPAASRDQAWENYFKHPRGAFPHELTPGHAAYTVNMQKVVTAAAERAAQHSRAAIDTDDFIEALFGLEEGRFNLAVETLGTTRTALLEAYRDMRVGTIAATLHNDLAATADLLGYDSYAEAIASFLVHADTPPPLSVSIQAPWGAGKSSLMNLIRFKLDPDAFKSADEREAELRGAARLALSDVLTILNKKVSRDAPAGANFEGESLPPATARAATSGLNALLSRLGQRFKSKPSTDMPAKPDVVPLKGLGKRLTIWFNVWKYETSEQIWAGLVDAIVSQICERLPPLDREKFLLGLHLSRIDDGIVRRKIYDRIAHRTWAVARGWVLATGVAFLAFVGLGAAGIALGGQGLWAWLAAACPVGATSTMFLLLSGLAWKYWTEASKTKAEQASFSLTDYLQVPDYHTAVGQIHQIHADLRRVLAKAPSITDGMQHDPIVIFIDDLDRCSPGKIANVVEGVSMLLGSNTYRCMFVIGMDPQMVAAALEKAHEDVRSQLPPYEQAVPLGWRFMDKFVQLPFTIPPSRKDRLDRYLTSLGASEDSVASDPTQAADVGRRFELNLQATTEPVASVEVARADTPAAHPPPADSAPALPATLKETRDVGRIIRRVSSYTAGNPREAKRMVNLARLYLLLRNARSAAEPNWNPPSLDQYARWIALTLRWPDMMRWLQWGSDDGAWTAGDISHGLIVRRLQRLEYVANIVGTYEDWVLMSVQQLGLEDAKKVGWINDRKLFDFFTSESKLKPPNRISDAARAEFW